MKKITSILLIITLFATMLLMTGCEKAPATNEAWKGDVLESYNEFIQEVAGNQDRIPIIVTTDQHGSVSKDSEVYSYINEIADWNKISKIINLGDTVKRMGNKKDLNDYLAATECLPEGKRIEIMGNHDRLYLGNREKLKKTYFSTKNAEVNDENNAFVVYDSAYNVRYLSVDPEQFPWTYKNGRLSTSQADFIVAELEKNDASDIIFVSHPYLFKDDMITRDGEHFTGSDYFVGSDKKYTEVKESFVKMLSARKAKASGVLVDCSGVEHPYDFTKCQGDFLMTLHGHHHQEGYETKDGVTEFLFQSLVHDNKDDTEPNCVYFAYIDRAESVFKCWKVAEGKRYDAWTISIG